jgi:hypothetical protein
VHKNARLTPKGRALPPEIAAIARVLEVKKMLSGNAARKIFFSSLRKRKGSLMRF